MYKPDTLTRRGSLRSLRSAPLLSTVLESTLSLTRIHPIASLELPGLDYAVHSQSAFGLGLAHPRDLAALGTCTSLRSGLAAITAASASAAGGVSQSQSALLGRYGPNASIRHGERKIVQPKRYVFSIYFYIKIFRSHPVEGRIDSYLIEAQNEMIFHKNNTISDLKPPETPRIPEDCSYIPVTKVVSSKGE